VKEPRKAAKEGGDSDPMKEMREQYDRATEMERPNRILGLDDLRFVAVPGNQWDDSAKKARKNRPCYEFPILRSHWRQVVNDQKKARPAIKVRGLRDATAEGAELRQGLIRNIESTCNAAYAYDSAFEMLVAAGMMAWRVRTKYSEDDGWEQDFVIEGIKDALNSVWMTEDGKHGFIEESIPRDEFKARWPDAEAVDFDSNTAAMYGDWFGQEDIRIAEWWRKVPVTKTICLLSDGRSMDGEDYAPIADELEAQGVTCVKQRKVQSHKVVSSIVSGKEELEGPFESVFHDIPIILKYANRHYIDGKWHWMGMVRPSRDPQKLLNYNFTAGQEALAKQHKSTPIVTPKMLEGKGVKAMWDNSNAADTPYLPITPDPQMPGGPVYLTAPPIHQGFTAMGQMSIDMLKASDGIYDASVGARSNETSGRAINARREEGDTATFDYQDKLAEGIQQTGELIGRALPAVYDTPRAVRILGKDGGEDWKQLYEEVVDQQTGQTKVINDLSAGKYDYTVTTGPSYDTQRMEFVDMLVQLSQGNPLVQQAVPDLIVGAMDFPKADEAAERLKLFLPPQVQQALSEGKDMPPEVQQAMNQVQQMGQQLQEQQAMLAEEAQKVAQEKAQVDGAKASISADLAKLAAEHKVMAAEFNQKRAELENMILKAQGQQQQEAPQAAQEPAKPAQGAGELAVANAVAQSLQGTLERAEAISQTLQQAETIAERIEQAAMVVAQPRTRRGTLRRNEDGSHSVEVVEE
jgi:hypothetical protein